MDFFILSKEGSSVGLAIRLQEEGNRVALAIQDEEVNRSGEGLVERVEEWNLKPTREAIVICDCTGNGFVCDLLRLGGTPLVGGSLIADRLEEDREFATNVFKECGIKTPKSKEFRSWEDARQYVEACEERLVFKPEGRQSGVTPSFATENNKQLLGMLEHYEKNFVGEPVFELQEFIDGCEISTEGWFDGTKFLRPFNHTLETKKFLDGDRGPSGGCTGNVVWACDDFISDHLFSRLGDYFSRHPYVGPIDVNSIVTEDGDIYALEFTPRFGFDATPTLLFELWEGELGKFFSDLARGQFTNEMPLLSGFGAGVRVSVPPWPTTKFHADAGAPIQGLRSGDYYHFWPFDVMEKDDELVTSGGVGIVGVFGGYGDTPTASLDEAYKIVERVQVPHKQYRSDLREVFAKRYRKVAKLAEVEA